MSLLYHTIPLVAWIRCWFDTCSEKGAVTQRGAIAPVWHFGVVPANDSALIPLDANQESRLVWKDVTRTYFYHICEVNENYPVVHAQVVPSIVPSTHAQMAENYSNTEVYV